MRLSYLLVLGCLSSLAQAPTDPVREWVTRHAIRLETPEAGHGFGDMAALKKVVGEARIVSLGEATHGTREFFQLKHRILEYLATEMGFNIFSIEANMPEAYRLNDYVLNGTGDPARLLKGMYFWTWNTQEVLDMIRWMREFNKSGKGRLQFTGFDMQTPIVSAQVVRDFLTSRDPAYSDSAEFRKTQAMAFAPSAQTGSFGVATGSFPVKDAAGKRVHYSGYIKTENVTRGYAGLWWRVDGPGEPGRMNILAFDNMSDRGVTGTTDWKRYEIDLLVAENAKNINFGVLFPGEGTAWFDSLAVELDAKRYDKPDLDFGFETVSFTGFYTGGNGYQVGADTSVVHSGKQSLRMTRVAPPQDAVDPRVASAAWQAAVRHMEDSRAAYGKAGAAAKDVEWAIQNARVVAQCMQMRANTVTRDRSMAENVKWILDQNPGAKIVLWAHNGHVSTATLGSYEPMGAALRHMYGDKIVVFGFAFNQGSFQAISQGKGLKDFTVPPAPAGSLDTMLASTGIPLFALDLRQAPTDAPVAAWWNEPHKTRSIGAMYPEDSPYALMAEHVAPKAYDALLFVEKTTAARENPELPAMAEFRDEQSGLTLKLPAGWGAREPVRFGSNETTVRFSGPPEGSTASMYFRVFAEPKKMTPEEIDKALHDEPHSKQEQRRSEGLKGYTMREGSCTARQLAGHAALSCIGDFQRDGRAMSEYLTWVRAEKVLVQFFGMAPADRFDAYRLEMDRVIEGLSLP